MKFIDLLWGARQRTPRDIGQGRSRLGLSEHDVQFAARPIVGGLVDVSKSCERSDEAFFREWENCEDLEAKRRAWIDRITEQADREVELSEFLSERQRKRFR